MKRLLIFLILFSSVCFAGSDPVQIQSDTIVEIDIDTSAELAALMVDETGSGALVFGTSPTITGATLTSPTISGATITTSSVDATTVSATTFTENGNAVPNVSDNLSVFAATTSAQLAGVLSDETGGTGVAVFGTSPTITTSLSQDGDVADSGYLRLANASVIGWEASPASTDITLTVDSSEVMQSSGTFNAGTLTEGGNGVPNSTNNLSFFASTTSSQLAGVLSDETGGTGVAVFGTSPTITTSISQDGDPADAGYLRLANAANIAWEAAPTGTDGTLTLNSSEAFVFAPDGSTQATLDVDGIDLVTGNAYEINNTSVLNATTLGTAVVTSSLTTVGTITSGTWNATDVAVAAGGTGQSTATEGFDALAPTTTKGDLIIRDTSDNVRLAVGTANQVPMADSDSTGGIRWGWPVALASGITSNCEITFSGSTMTISSDDGTSGTSDPCLVGIKHQTDGTNIVAEFTANVTLTFGATSDSDGNLFGITDADWANSMPLFIGVIHDGTSAFFTISRLPIVRSGTVVGDVCQKADTDCDAQSDVMILTTGLTLANWINLPITQVGWVGATYATTGSAWNILHNQDKSGFNAEYETVRFTFPVAQNGAATGSHFKANGGTAPLQTSQNYTYFVRRDLTIYNEVYQNADAGTDGAGAVQMQLSTPFTIETGAGGMIMEPMCGTAQGATTITAGTGVYCSMTDGNSHIEPKYQSVIVTTIASVTNAMFSNGGRYLKAQFIFSAM